MLQARVDHQYYTHPTGLEREPSPNLVEEEHTLTFPYGVVYLKQWRFDGIVIRHTKSNFNGYFFFENINSIEAVGLEFNLKGNYEIHHVGQVYQVKSRQHNIIYSPGVHNTFYNRDLQGETFKIYFQPSAFLDFVSNSNDTVKRFTEGVKKKLPSVMAKVSPLVNPELYKAIQEIIHCRFAGGLRKIFLLSKCMEILVMQAEAFDEAERKSESKNGKNDREKIHFAKEYIVKNFDNPPSLCELSRIAGINEYKLKRDFKKMFHTTVFGYLANYRLEKSRKVLLENNKTISEVAYEMGYSSPQHFSSAFKKRFGVSPKSLKQ